MGNTAIYQPEIGFWFKDNFLIANNLSQSKLAMDIKVDSMRISKVVNGRLRITANLDARFCKYFGKSRGFFLKKQIEFDIKKTDKDLEKIILSIKKFKK